MIFCKHDITDATAFVGFRIKCDSTELKRTNGGLRFSKWLRRSVEIDATGLQFTGNSCAQPWHFP
jgi:hypothetical protein